MTARKGCVRIGIFSAPMPTALLGKAASYLKRDYLEWIELSGALPVVIPYNTDSLDEYLNSVHGVVWVGGAVENQKIHSAAQYAKLQHAYAHAFHHAMQENQRGNYYPIWGTCLGFDFLALMGQKHPPNVSEMAKIHKSHPGTLRFQGTSRLRRVFSAAMQEKLTREPVTRQRHSRGFDPEAVHMPYLRVISVDTSDQSSRRFVNAFEYRHFPFYGTQWHPESPVSNLSNDVSIRLSRFFKRECAKNRHRSPWVARSGHLKSKETVLLI